MIKYYFAHDSKFPAVLFISAKDYMEMCLGFFYSLVDSAVQFWHKLLLFKPNGKEKKNNQRYKICDIFQLFFYQYIFSHEILIFPLCSSWCFKGLQKLQV